MNQATEPDFQKLKAVTAAGADDTPDASAAAKQPAVAQLLHLADLGSMDEVHANRGMPLNAANAASAVRTASDGSNPLHQIKTRLTVCVGAAEVTVGELLGAREQQVLLLDRTVEQPVDVMLEGQVIARGVLIAVDDHFGVRITELPVSLTA